MLSLFLFLFIFQIADPWEFSIKRNMYKFAIKLTTFNIKNNNKDINGTIKIIYGKSVIPVRNIQPLGCRQ